MFKKMLKGILAVGAALAIAIPAHAEVSGILWTNVTIDQDGTSDVSYWGSVGNTLKGEKTAISFTLYGDDGTVGVWDYGFDWMFSDSMTLHAGQRIFFTNFADSGINPSYNTGNFGYYGGASAHLFMTEVIDVTMKLGDSMKVIAGIATGAEMVPYVYVQGSAGDISYNAGAKMNTDEMGIVVAGSYKIGDLGKITADIRSKGSFSYTGLAYNDLKLGPGTLGFAMHSNSNSVSMQELCYKISIEPGANFTIDYAAGDNGGDVSEMGVSFEKYF